MTEKAKNKNLKKAKAGKNDEFYTELTDIEKELRHYKDHFKGLMGVPITFIDKYNPEQFEILGIDRVLVEEATGKVTRFRIAGQEIYARIIIKNKRL